MIFFKHSWVLLLFLIISSCKKKEILLPPIPITDQNELHIPPLIDARNFPGGIAVSIQNGNHEFYAGKASVTRGFNGNYLGPTIRMHKGETTRIHFTNNIGEPTTVHGHGLHVPGDIDGGPQLRILPGETWDAVLPIVQEASTNWYHPHLMGKTAEHVHSGLAGLYLIEDANSESLNIPKEYGVDDIPIIVQDRTFNNGVMVPYPKGLRDGHKEQTLVINGTVNPYLTVPKGNVRLRILNGSNARSYEFYIKGNAPFSKIATEGGFLNAPVTLTRLSMAPGERNEIVIDMTKGNVELMAKYLRKKTKYGLPDDPEHRVIELKVNPKLKPKNTVLAQNLNSIQPYNTTEVKNERFFDLEGMSINGKQMDMMVINERVKLGELEKWKVSSGRHPFHMHGTSFLILTVNGNTPPPEDRGWKDVIMPYGNAEILLKFEHKATAKFPYMYHCHTLEHEDMGMMGQFTVE